MFIGVNWSGDRTESHRFRLQYVFYSTEPIYGSLTLCFLGQGFLKIIESSHQLPFKLCLIYWYKLSGQNVSLGTPARLKHHPEIAFIGWATMSWNFLLQFMLNRISRVSMVCVGKHGIIYLGLFAFQFIQNILGTNITWVLIYLFISFYLGAEYTFLLLQKLNEKQHGTEWI